MRSRLLLTVVILTALSLYAVVFAQDVPTEGTVPITNLYLPLVSYSVPPPSPTATWTVTPAPDRQAPQLVTWSFAPGSIATKDAAQIITFSGRFTDNNTGVGQDSYFAEGIFESPSGRQEVHVFFRASHLNSGNLLDGVFDAEMRVPKLSETGTWKLWYFWMADDAGNDRQLDPADMRAHQGLPISFQVKN